MKKDVGLFFGSFNPIHVGHAILASYVADNSDLDQVWFVVSPQNPLKKRSNLLEFHHRFSMVQLTVQDDPRFRAIDIERHLPQPSYTVDTLANLSEKYPDYRFSLIMGGDNISTFHKWKNYEAILENYSIICYSRPDSGTTELSEHPKVTILNAPLMEYSSSHIRDMIKQGNNVKYLMPETAWNYLDQMNLYK